MSHAQKYGFWLISFKPLDQLKKSLQGQHIFCPIHQPTSQIFLYFSQISGKFFTMGQKWTFGQNPSLIFSFRHRQAQLGTLLTYSRHKKSLSIQLYKDSNFERCAPLLICNRIVGKSYYSGVMYNAHNSTYCMRTCNNRSQIITAPLKKYVIFLFLLHF